MPITVQKQSEKEAVHKTVNDRQCSKPEEVIPWPKQGDTPINEFITEGYISCAFPIMLPTGDADFLAPQESSLTVGYYFKHLMKCEDGRLKNIHIFYILQ